MNAKRKRLAAMVLAGALCLSMAGCGDKEDSSTAYKTLAQELGYGYTSEYVSLDDMELDYVNSTSIAQGKLFLCGDYYDEATGENDTRLYQREIATGSTTELKLPELVNNDTTSEYIVRMSVCADGSAYWVLSNQYTFMGNAEAVPAEEMPAEEMPTEEAPAEEASPEEAPVEETGDVAENPEELSGRYELQLLSEETPLEEAPAEEAPAEETPAEEAPVEEMPAEESPEDPDQETGEVQEDVGVMPISQGPEQMKYRMRKCDLSGNVLLEFDLTAAVQEMEYFYCQAMTQDTAGNLYLVSDQAIICFGADGSRLADIPLENMYIESIVAGSDGTVLAGGFNYENGKPLVCRVENGALSQPIEIADSGMYGNISLYPGSGSTMLMSDGELLYSLDAATGETTKLLSWLDADINGNNITGIVADGEDTVLVLLQDYRRNTGMYYELGTLTKTPVDELPERTILTLGAEYLDDVVRNAVIDFNRTNQTYRVTLVDYSDYNTEDDYTAGAQQLSRDIISGSCPDILSLDSGSAAKYIAKGALADLTGLMEKDREITQDSLVSGPLKAYMSDGKLYGMPYSFGLNTVYASYKLVGDRESWNLADMGQIMDGLEDGVKVTQWMNQTDFLNTMVYQNLGQFVDYANASCSFDSDAFKNLMAVASRLPESYEPEAGEGEYAVAMDSGDEMAQLQNGDLLMAMGYGVSDSYSIKYMYRLYSKENGIVRIGYPTEEGNGAMLNIYGSLAIGAKSKNQEGAWAFVKSMLSDKVQENQWGLPVSKTAFDQVLAEAMEKDYYMDGGEKVYVDSTGYIGNTEYQIGELTQEQAEQFRAYVDGATVSGSYDMNIMEIIGEESAAYFAGDKSADEVAGLIQNRVSIYLGETS